MIKRQLTTLTLPVALSLLISGCESIPTMSKDDSSKKSNTETVQQEQAKAPAGSKFAKLSVGMSKTQVTDLIGIWSDYEVYSTGKAYIPFYHGKDKVRTTLYYKNEGIIVIGGNDRVVSINYDAKEDGYK
ncbi:hypothetical protein EDC56_1647 [Sinobacterium caligoides]|uniref:Uncharacterized protein n=1 Tax=Sinobacterium caligoides TaxID=933926 RepID=A0A3N2DN28_9GAMM|nr:hypothetical protein [Sinobacterium caligoides]ROS01218.1 hypothetical protein EDC56_1647 [Sinobacterium caligoides]